MRHPRLSAETYAMIEQARDALTSQDPRSVMFGVRPTADQAVQTGLRPLTTPQVARSHHKRQPPVGEHSVSTTIATSAMLGHDRVAP